MMLDQQTLFNWLVGVIAAAFGWWLKTLHARAQRRGVP